MPRSRKEKGHYGSAYRRLRSTVLAEEIICYLCGEGVDKTLHWRHPGAPQLHLLIPLTRGGSWRDRQNARLTHRLCNIRQNNKLEGEVAVTHQRPESHWVVCADP
jgi:5-methylcytosine-specific restriction endonuclease McrA